MKMSNQPRREKINRRPKSGESRTINYIRIGISIKKELYNKTEEARQKYPDPKPSKSGFISYLIALGLSHRRGEQFE